MVLSFKKCLDFQIPKINDFKFKYMVFQKSQIQDFPLFP